MASPSATIENILEPDLPIVDPHHHLWDLRPGRRMPRYLFDDLNADMNRGHNVTKTVFVECSANYKVDGPVEMQPIGETEFVNGVAAMFASGLYGDRRGCAGIVGAADLALGDAIAPVLEKHIEVANGRFRGIRVRGAWDADTTITGGRTDLGSPERYLDPKFREGFRHLGRLGLTFEIWLYDTQLGDALDLARAFPDTPMVLNHVGGPLALGVYKGQREAKFPAWRDHIRALAKCGNIYVKVGGLGMNTLDWPHYDANPPASSERLASDWKPYVETCIEAFGPERSMFESNFPVDMHTCPYDVLWNAFKRLAAGYSADEKTHLFSGAASRFYRV